MDLRKIRDTKRKHQRFMVIVRRAVHCACFLVLLFVAVAVQAQEPAKPTRAQKIVEQGIAVEFTVDLPSA